MNFNKVVIWGHPLHSHTHSYIHESFHKAFSFMGFKTYWFHDESFPSDFDWGKTLFITEGFASNKIPIRENSYYFVMYEPDPKRFVQQARYIELRLCATLFQDHVSNYSFQPDLCKRVESSVYFKKGDCSTISFENSYNKYSILNYDVVYLNWATDLLPNEINLKDIYFPRSNHFFFSGTISRQGKNENYSKFKPLIKNLKKRGIKFIHNNPWDTPLSSDEVRKRTKESIVGLDLRGPKHLKENLVTCRVFKNASYGHLAATNSKAIFNEMNGIGVFSENPEELLELALSNRFNYGLIREGMEIVRNNHTYVNLVNGLLRSLQLMND